MLLSCIEVSFWNLSFCGEYIRSFKSIRLIFCVKKVLNSRSYPYPKFIKGFLYHFISGTGAFCKKAKLGFKRLWTLYPCKILCIRTFICRSLQVSECRFDPLSYHSREFDLFLGPESAHEKHCILSKNDKYKKFSFLFELFKNFQKGYKKGYCSALVFHEAQEFPIKSRKMY